MKTENAVANCLKGYGVFNAVACLIFGLILHNNLPGALDYLWIVEVSAGLVASFLLYAFGEVVQILHDIRNNTSSKESDQAMDDELPDL